MQNTKNTQNTKNFNFFLLGFLAFNSLAYAVDFTQIEKDLKSQGVVGTLHGVVEAQGLYVFTYRNPKDFFDYAVMSLVSGQADINQTLSSLSRHDGVLVKGQFLDNPSPQKHILVSSLDLTKKFDSGYPVAPYPHEAKLPEDLLHLDTANFLVHAVAGDGHILVAEFKDSVVPIFVKNANFTQNLFRNDIVKLNFKIQEKPNQPVHLVLNEDNPVAVEVLESIQALHGKVANISGALVMFPKSPEIIFNVFAVDQGLEDGLRRQYTLVNFDDPALFKQIREMLQAAWDQNAGDYRNGRNKLIANHLRVKVTGIYNVTSPNQANPQILIHSLNDLVITDRK